MKKEKSKKKKGCLIPILIVLALIILIIGSIAKSEKAKEPFEQLVNLPLSEAMSSIDELGYSAKYFYDNGTDNNDYTDTVNDVISKDKKQLDKYIITRYKNIDNKNKSVDLFINTKENIKSQEIANELENKLGHINACQAAEQYGINEYGNFKLHYVTDLKGFEAVDGNSWKIKCSATIISASGIEQNVICEAVITGTNEKPNVIEFNVY